MVWRQNVLKAYRALLFAYPSEFRQEYGEEMQRVFVMRLGTEPLIRLLPDILADVAITAPKEHFHILAADVRQSARALAKAPGFTAAALLAIALGVGASTTVFSLINAVLLRSLPYGDPERLVCMWTPAPQVQGLPREMAPPYADVFDWRKMSHSFADITAVQRDVVLLNCENPVRLTGAKVLGNFFQTMKAVPQLGRPIEASDDGPGQPRVVVISGALWHSRFKGDPDVLGKTMLIDGQRYRVVGVMPERFAYPRSTEIPGASPTLGRTDLWIPAALTPRQKSDRTALNDEPDIVIGRLRSGVSLRQAQSEMSAIEKRLLPLYSPGQPYLQSLLVPFVETAIGPVRPLLYLITGAVLLVLFIAGANVANLLLARGADRVHEIGVRTALGAERARLLRLTMTESLLISLAGGAMGALLSFAALKTLVKLNPGDIPRFEEAGLDLRVLFFGVSIAVATGLISGIFPALSGSFVNVSELLRQGGRGIASASMGTRNTLIISEVALAVVLLAATGLLIRSYLAVKGEDKGFAGSTLTMNVDIDHAFQSLPTLSQQPQAVVERHIATLVREVVGRIRSIRGVEAAGAIDDLPLSHSEDVIPLEVEGYPHKAGRTAGIRHTSGEYFRAMQIRLVAGRYSNDVDIPSDPAAAPRSVVVSETLAKRYFPRCNAVGHRLRLDEKHWSTIIGVVEDVRHSSLEKSPDPIVYQPSWLGGTLAIRTTLAPSVAVSSIRKALSGLNGTALTDIRTMNEYVAEATARRRFQTVVLVAFAAIAVLLGLVGLYGLLSYAVRQRTAEIGVRMAMGASRSTVVGMIIQYGLKLTATGLAIGLASAFALTRAMSGLLYGVDPADPVTFIAVPACLVIVTLIACLIPAWKAARIDPVDALRRS